MHPGPLLLALASGLIFGGCSDPPEDSGVARQIVGPAGGLVTSVDSVLTIAIPPGALEEELEIFIERTNEPPDVFGQAYLVRPNPALLFDASVTYRKDLPENTSGLAVGAVDFDAYEAGAGGWVPLPVLRVDREAKLVSGLDDGLSIFYALLDDADASSTTSSTGTTTTTTTTTTSGATDGTTGALDDTTGAPDDTTGPAATDESSGTSESSGEPASSFAREVEPILMASCSCHYDGAPAELSYSTDAFGSLVGTASTQVPALDRVAPGLPDDSYLWHKLNDTHVAAGGSGNPMPAPTGGLAAGSLAIIEAWILDGAAP